MGELSTFDEKRSMLLKSRSAAQTHQALGRLSNTSCYTHRVSTTPPAIDPASSAKTPEERALASKLVRQWEEAQTIADKYSIDVNGVLNVIRGLALSPAERIELGLRAARLGDVTQSR